MPYVVSRAVLAGVLVIAWASTAAGKSADLRPKFPKDRVTYYRTVTNITHSIETPHRSMQMKIKQEFGIRLTVKEAQPSGAEVEYTMLYAAVEAELPSSPLSIDTRKPAGSSSNPTVNDLKAVLNKPILIRISPDGEVGELNGAKEILEALPRIMAHMITEEMLREDQQLRMPGRKALHPTQVGHKWEDRMESPVRGGKSINSITYTLESVDPKAQTARIVAKSVLGTEPQDGARMTALAREGEGSGRIIWDIAKGEVVRLESEIRSASKARQPGGGPNSGMSSEQTINRTTERVALKDFNLRADTNSTDKRDTKGNKNAKDKPSDK